MLLKQVMVESFGKDWRKKFHQMLRLLLGLEKKTGPRHLANRLHILIQGSFVSFEKNKVFNQYYVEFQRLLNEFSFSRFCTPAGQCPIIDPAWEDSKGVPIAAILFGGRRPKGVPLVYEGFDWKHSVFIGSAMRSEATAAAEHKGKIQT